MDNLFSSIGNIASIIGVLITAYLLFELKRLRTHFLLKARFPSLLKSLSSHANQLSNVLQYGSKSQRDIETLLKVCDATLKNLYTKVSGLEHQSTKSLIKKIKKLKKPTDKEIIWEIYDGLQGLIEALKHLQKDSKWSQ
jgi:hypothetical protein